jgi:hypothetical protein
MPSLPWRAITIPAFSSFGGSGESDVDGFGNWMERKPFGVVMMRLRGRGWTRVCVVQLGGHELHYRGQAFDMHQLDVFDRVHGVQGGSGRDSVQSRP